MSIISKLLFDNVLFNDSSDTKSISDWFNTAIILNLVSLGDDKIPVK